MNLLIEWNGERIKELFEELEKQNNWQFFYQSFDVVESEKKTYGVSPKVTSSYKLSMLVRKSMLAR